MLKKDAETQGQVGVFNIYVYLCSIRVRILQHVEIDWE
jgi:hypothetical protein